MEVRVAFPLFELFGLEGGGRPRQKISCTVEYDNFYVLWTYKHVFDPCVSPKINHLM
jgi:hypothetical protein